MLLFIALQSVFSLPARATERVINTASAGFNVGDTPMESQSNRVVVVLRTRAKVTFYKYAPTIPEPEVKELTVTEYKDPASGIFHPMPPPGADTLQRFT